ncbi:Rne/Rng family ribonuclease [Desulfovibrio sp. SGI.169]|uniref:Rne/Rng family ribonuclease n=1 Tax=Desulfovibrio sp. SGI.169 TaxID=3420561 RepID=UPI003D01BBA7
MTTDQDFSVAASHATDGASQDASSVSSASTGPAASGEAPAEAPAPKRRASSRSSRKPAVQNGEAATTPAADAPPESPANAPARKARGGGRAAAKSAEGGEESAAPRPRAPKRAAGKSRAARVEAESGPTAPAESGPNDVEAAPASAARPAPGRARSATRATTRSPRAQKAATPATSAQGDAAPAPTAEESPSEAKPTADAPAAKSPKRASRTRKAPAASDVTLESTEQTLPEETLPLEAVEADEATAAESGSEDAAETHRRKSRRGRRGGRGRSRKSRAPATDETGENEAAVDEHEAFARQEGDIDEAEAPSPADAGEAAAEAPAPKSAKKSKSAPAAGNESGKKTATRAASARARADATAGKRRMFISVLPGEQVEVALAEEGRLLEYYLDMLHQRKIKGNIYKGVIHNIDTNLQAAFVSYGAGKNGFLQIDEIHPEYWQAHHEPAKGKKFPPIQKVLKAGQEVLVQVVKEPTGNKGAFLTTWLSLAGRFLVLTPGQEQIGVSRKVESDEERARLRDMMNGIDPGQGLGVIVRTVSAGTTKTTLKTDLQYLKRLWRDIRKKATEVAAPALIHQEPGLSERAVRDYLTDDVCEIWVDNEDVAQGIRDTANLLFPRKKDLVRLHGDIRQSMWERFNLRRQLDQIYSREVTLPSGGRLVFDQTEALMAIDINSGKISGKGNFEAMAYKTNMEAAETIARQLRLRDIGGQVVIDFIEMRDKKHVLEVEKTLRQAMKNDRARHDVARMSSFGLLELVRQRTGSSALAITMEPCPACGGTGQRRNLEWQALQGLRELRRMLRASNGEKCVFETSRELGLYLLNHKRDTLREMEQDFGKCLEIAIRT